MLHHESSVWINYFNPGYSLSLFAAMFLLSAFWDMSTVLLSLLRTPDAVHVTCEAFDALFPL